VKKGIRASVVAFLVVAGTVLMTNVASAAPAIFPFH